MPTYLLKGGIIATWTKENQARSFKADVLVEGTTITQIAENISAPAGAEVIDCTNKWITPGFIDTHRYDIVFSIVMTIPDHMGEQAYMDDRHACISMRVRTIGQNRSPAHTDPPQSWLLTEYLVKSSWCVPSQPTLPSLSDISRYPGAARRA